MVRKVDLEEDSFSSSLQVHRAVETLAVSKAQQWHSMTGMGLVWAASRGDAWYLGRGMRAQVLDGLIVDY